MDAAVDASEATFGPLAASRYRMLLEAALDAIRTNPHRPTAAPRPEFGPDTRFFHLQHARKLAPRVRRPRHIVVFRIVGPDIIVVDRLLHDAMDILRHLPQTDSDED